jgi:CRP/FNR family transcriptional regulator, cyclic AMP receptor protein
MSLPVAKNTSLSAKAVTFDRLFTAVDAAARDFVLASALPVTLKKSVAVFEKGDASSSMYIVQSGRLEISMVSQMGRKIVLNQIAPGQCIGEIGMLDTLPRTASAIAVENSKLLSVSRKVFLEAVEKSPQLAINLMEVLCERLRWVSDSVEEYALHSLDLRLARRLLVMEMNFSDEHGFINITQTDLADFAGATRESVNKLLMQWKGDGLIEVSRGKILVLDRDRLGLFAHGETAG